MRKRGSYTEADPINATDPSGLHRIRIWASAFIPEDQITFIHRFRELPTLDANAKWHGDNRSFAWGDSTSVFNATFSSRVWHEIVIETDPTISFDPVIFNEADTGRTIVDYSVFGLPRHDEGKAPKPTRAAVSRQGCTIKVDFMASASNPLEGADHIPFGLLPAPTIDYAYYLRFDLDQNDLYIAGYYDKFPAQELYIASDTGTSLALVRAMPSGAAHSPFDLASLPILIQPVTVQLPAAWNDSCGCQ